MNGSTYQLNAAPAILSVGDPGSGKSRLAFSLPNLGILDCDGNLGSAICACPTKDFEFEQPFRTPDGKEVPEVERWTRACTQTKALLTNPKVKSFTLDGLSNLCRWGLIYAEDALIKSGINVKKEYLAKYQSFIPLMSNFITMLRIPGKLVMVSVHQTMEKDELTGSVRYELDIPGRLKNTLGGQFTDVWGMSSLPDPGSKVGAKYLIRTKPSGFHVNLKTSLDLEPSIDITGKGPDDIWKLLEPKLSVNIVPVTK